LFTFNYEIGGNVRIKITKHSNIQSYYKNPDRNGKNAVGFLEELLAFSGVKIRELWKAKLGFVVAAVANGR
jgi:hypothetical protein